MMVTDAFSFYKIVKRMIISKPVQSKSSLVESLMFLLTNVFTTTTVYVTRPAFNNVKPKDWYFVFD